MAAAKARGTLDRDAADIGAIVNPKKKTRKPTSVYSAAQQSALRRIVEASASDVQRLGRRFKDKYDIQPLLKGRIATSANHIQQWAAAELAVKSRPGYGRHVDHHRRAAGPVEHVRDVSQVGDWEDMVPHFPSASNRDDTDWNMMAALKHGLKSKGDTTAAAVNAYKPLRLRGGMRSGTADAASRAASAARPVAYVEPIDPAVAEVAHVERIAALAKRLLGLEGLTPPVDYFKERLRTNQATKKTC